MPELERMLTQLGRELDWPETPDLAAEVTARVRAESAQAPARRRRPAPFLPAAGLRRSLALALVGLLLLAGTVFAAAPGVRRAVLDLLGLRGATIERRQALPPPPPQRPLDLGERTTLAAARARLGFEPLVPADPGTPEAVYVRRGPSGGELSLAYRSRAGLPRARPTSLGLLVGEFRGDLSPAYVGKVAGQATRIERLRIDGQRAIWIEGAPHFFFYRRPGGGFADSELRLAQNVLLLERGNLLLRFEGAFGRERAITVARSLP